MTKRKPRYLFGVLFFLVAVGCATYQGKVDSARNLLAAGKPDASAKLLEPLATKEGDDQLVYLFDYGVVLQSLGDYRKSNDILIQADKMSEVKDYHSLSRVAGSLLLSEELVQYKGEDFEKVLVNAVSAINYLMLGDLDEALVETRRLNEKLHRYKVEAKRDYEQNVFARYLSAVIWEASGQWDDAYIDYEEAYRLKPDYRPLREYLVRSAIKAQRPDKVEKWRKAFPEIKISPLWNEPGYGELVFIFQQGWGPRKGPHPESPRFPKLFPVFTRTKLVEVLAEGVPPAGSGVLRSEPLYSVQSVAIKMLDDAYGELVAKRMAGIVTKHVVADQIRQKNEALGLIALVGLHLSDRADLRQWSTLPESFQIVRMPLKVGTYHIRANGLDYGGIATGEQMAEKEIEIKPRSKTFLTWRSFR